MTYINYYIEVKMNKYLDLFLTFSKIGAFTFGGGYAMIPLIEQEVVEKKQGKPLNYVIMSPDDFSYRKNVHDRFVMEILEMEISEIIDPEKLIKE